MTLHLDFTYDLYHFEVSFAFVLSEHCFQRGAFQLFYVVEYLVRQRFQLLLLDASGALYHVLVPRLLVHDLVRAVDCHSSEK